LKTASVGPSGQKMPEYELAGSMRALVVTFQDALSAIEADPKLSSTERVMKSQDAFHTVQNGALQIRDAEWTACDTHTAALDAECRAALPKVDSVTSAAVVKSWDELDPVEHMIVWPNLDTTSKSILVQALPKIVKDKRTGVPRVEPRVSAEFATPFIRAAAPGASERFEATAARRARASFVTGHALSILRTRTRGAWTPPYASEPGAVRFSPLVGFGG